MPDLQLEEDLWLRVHAQLDLRRDPFDDAALARDLAARPRVARRVRALVGALPAATAARRPRSFALALAAAGLVAVLLPLALRRARPVPVQPVGDAPDVALEVVRCAPAPARGDLRRLEPRPVLAWNRPGERP